MADLFKESETKDILILGVGNILFGDDAFGPAVVDKLVATGSLPDYALAEDVGTSVRDIVFNVALAAKKPKLVIVLDAVEMEGREPGEVFEIEVKQIPKVERPNFFFHQFSTTNMLYELREHSGIDVKVIAAQAKSIPDHLVEGMSDSMLTAVDKAVELILEICSVRP